MRSVPRQIANGTADPSDGDRVPVSRVASLVGETTNGSRARQRPGSAGALEFFLQVRLG